MIDVNAFEFACRFFACCKFAERSTGLFAEYAIVAGPTCECNTDLFQASG